VTAGDRGSGPRDHDPVTTTALAALKRAGQPIVMVTAYDAPFARLVDEAGVDAILVGDSVALVIAGEDTTLPATVEQMIYHARIVTRAAQRPLVVVDLPFLSYQVSVSDAIGNAGRILKETGAGAVKLEGGVSVAPTIAALVAAGIPVMGHIGLTPQAVHQLGGLDEQGASSDEAERLLEDARAVERAGAFAVVLELVPAALGERITRSVSIPTIGIGAGLACDGQVLVLHDLLGLYDGLPPALSRRYAELGDATRDAVRRFADDVRTRSGA
jgi:3-methyl-2-oxobutanoate hydroxymethyltransferase